VWGSEKAGNQKQVRGLREVAHGAHSTHERADCQ
jgi:hypothetical protein